MKDYKTLFAVRLKDTKIRTVKGLLFVTVPLITIVSFILFLDMALSFKNNRCNGFIDCVVYCSHGKYIYGVKK